MENEIDQLVDLFNSNEIELDVNEIVVNRKKELEDYEIGVKSKDFWITYNIRKDVVDKIKEIAIANKDKYNGKLEKNIKKIEDYIREAQKSKKLSQENPYKIKNY